MRMEYIQHSKIPFALSVKIVCVEDANEVLATGNLAAFQYNTESSRASYRANNRKDKRSKYQRAYS